MLLNQAQQTIKKHQLINSGDKIIVGVSGGPDSVCLLHILQQLREEYKLDLIVAHVNYGYRGKEADKDEKYVKELAEEYKLACEVCKPTRSDSKSSNLEASAREIRYDFFQKLLEKEKADKIAVAHNQNDQVETILMFFLRGSGLKGLSGMDHQQGKIIRPLLDCSREDILKYLKKNKLEFRQDETNKDKTFTRNRLRHELIPHLQKEFNPNLPATLLQSARAIRDDYEFIGQAIKKTYKSLVDEKANKVSLSLEKFLQLELALQRGILRHIFIEFLGDTKDISFLDLEETRRILREGKSGSYREIKGLRIAKKSGKIVISSY